MKRIFFFSIALLFISIAQSQNVGIGTTSPAASAQLDVSSTTKGLLPPRMSDVQRNGISNPVAGLMIWCTNCRGSGEMQVYNGTNWTNMIGGSASPDTNTSISICTQVWMVRNLNVDKYRNGDPIPKITDPTAWAALTTGAYCFYNNDSATYAATYGKLYNWYALNDPRGLAPIEWHIPSNAEWNILVKCIDPAADTTCSNCSQSLTAGGAMKEPGTTHWTSPNTGATNSSGFTGIPGGSRANDGTFFNVGYNGFWWSSTEFNTSNAWHRFLDYSYGNVFRNLNDKRGGFSVRCIRD